MDSEDATPRRDATAPSHTTGTGDSPVSPAARTVLSGADIERVLTRIAHEIIEANKGTQDLLLLGIPRRGFPLAQRLAARIATTVDGLDPAPIVGQLDITMYRDDLRHGTSRTPAPTLLPPGGIDGKTVVLVDDVLYSGRTIRAALDALADIGRPRIVRLAVLVDRGHRELPIRADHVGKNLPTATSEKVRVRVGEVDALDGVPVNDVVIEAGA
ncbi:bifunctional pyr operon transcriptional regulator/uracil phosphoribosyltransferase PyrR [Zafaria sp. J156]|uniref:bifunctional pyr operon transcriptional regulator/uracil phosphoribosyltransferase PyrR n=1 Tax=Zafaria sp. J156 TaxID=3116490 RepID=UPI002E79FB21|nr:bifunctional pyr operon transcriptional regulator/uracil phosphoribosyltransferase PyrR [Zafaria sp. J156]MEE1621128.1 bifunctional pyr operon transcriptional regulator/uracil phosphoribosyltransferase PyrR [Zafaria sp. J156]